MLRWKLKRLVPFRVDELRVSAAEVAPLPGPGGAPPALLLGFAVEQLLVQVEDAFNAAGVRLGQISNVSLSLLAATDPPPGGGFAALMVVEDEGYTLVFSRGGEPVLHRYKGFAGALPEASRGSFVGRDLRLTRKLPRRALPRCPRELRPAVGTARGGADLARPAGGGSGGAGGASRTDGTCRPCAPRTPTCHPGATSPRCSGRPGGRWHEHRAPILRTTTCPSSRLPRPRHGRSSPCRRRLRAAIRGRMRSTSPAGRSANSRPVVRIAIILWLLGLALLASNVFVFRRYLSDSAGQAGPDRPAARTRSISSRRTWRISRPRLNGYDLVRLNDQIDFLNTQIDARAFSWSLLLDRIADTLPNDVRLGRLTPLTSAKAKKDTQRERLTPRDKMPTGEVESSTSAARRGATKRCSQFVNNLFAHPAFKDPNLLQESSVDGGGPLVKFDATWCTCPADRRTARWWRSRPPAPRPEPRRRPR